MQLSLSNLYYSGRKNTYVFTWNPDLLGLQQRPKTCLVWLSYCQGLTVVTARQRWSWSGGETSLLPDFSTHQMPISQSFITQYSTGQSSRLSICETVSWFIPGIEGDLEPLTFLLPSPVVEMRRLYCLVLNSFLLASSS